MTISKKIAVVNSKSFGKYFPEHLTSLEALGGVDVLNIDARLDSVAIAKQLEQYKCIIASVTPEFDADFFDQSPNLKLVARHGLGVDNVDIEAATTHGVYVTKVEGIVEQEAVAEHALSLMLSLIRHIPQANNSVRTMPWSQRSQYVGVELKNAKIGIIGYGNIGSRLGQILHNGFNAEVLVYDPYKSEDYIANYHGVLVSLDHLLTEADVISLNASANSANRGLLSYDEFKKMKKDVLIVNTARGSLVDEEALIDALSSRLIKGYAADVFAAEPLVASSHLLTFSNVLVTPHIGAYTYPSLKGMGESVISDVTAALMGRRPKKIINKGVIKS